MVGGRIDQNSCGKTVSVLLDTMQCTYVWSVTVIHLSCTDGDTLMQSFPLGSRPNINITPLRANLDENSNLFTATAVD